LSMALDDGAPELRGCLHRPGNKVTHTQCDERRGHGCGGTATEWGLSLRFAEPVAL